MFITKDSSICNFADDNTIYCSGNDIYDINRTLNKEVSLFLTWFQNNQLVANPVKCQLLYLGFSCSDIKALPKLMLDDIELLPKSSVKLLGVILDNKLNFNEHIKNICKVSSRNTNCLARIRKHINIKQSKLLYNAYIKSAFGYAPLVWMFCQKVSYKTIENIQKRALRLVFLEQDKSLNELCNLHKEMSIHNMHLCSLAVEIFKIFLNLNQSFMSELFIRKEQRYNLRISNLLKLPRAKTSKYGTFSVFFQGCLFWNSLPDHVKSMINVTAFKKKFGKYTGISKFNIPGFLHVLCSVGFA